MAFENVKQAIEDIKAGKMVVMTDDEDRENEGDVVCAAAFCDEAKVTGCSLAASASSRATWKFMPIF